MIIRKSTESDIPRIIQLLKASLGESLIPKSEELWNWKHVSNPFGKSPVLIAEENEELVGVRAFMNWKYKHDGNILQACRAVDTAVHPDFQGKGIFSKLTQKLLNQVKAEGIDLIYNTPNSTSTPGYLKLGWEKWDRLPLKIKPTFFPSKKHKEEVITPWDSISSFLTQLEKHTMESSEVSTWMAPGYIAWRYQNCPIAKYHCATDLSSYLFVFRVKEGRWGKELRICDLFLWGNPNPKDLKTHLKQVEVFFDTHFTTISGLAPNDILKNLPGFFYVPKLGPLVTVKSLNSKTNPLNLPWSWSLGDLEVF